MRFPDRWTLKKKRDTQTQACTTRKSIRMTKSSHRYIERERERKQKKFRHYSEVPECYCMWSAEATSTVTLQADRTHCIDWVAVIECDINVINDHETGLKVKLDIFLASTLLLFSFFFFGCSAHVDTCIRFFTIKFIIRVFQHIRLGCKIHRILHNNESIDLKLDLHSTIEIKHFANDTASLYKEEMEK